MTHRLCWLENLIEAIHVAISSKYSNKKVPRPALGCGQWSTGGHATCTVPCAPCRCAGLAP